MKKEKKIRIIIVFFPSLFYYLLSIFLYVICNCMILWGVAVLELDSYPDHNKGPKTKDPSHGSLQTT